MDKIVSSLNIWWVVTTARKELLKREDIKDAKDIAMINTSQCNHICMTKDGAKCELILP
jgi:hypothetical protein